MSLKLSEEQREFQDSLRALLSEECNSEYLRKRLRAPEDRDVSLWKRYQELGLFEYFSSKDPNTRPGMSDLGIVAFESGWALEPERLTETLLAGPFLFSQILDSKSVLELSKAFGEGGVEAILKGERRVVPILWQSRKNVPEPHTSLSATLEHVPLINASDLLLVCGEADAIWVFDVRKLSPAQIKVDPTNSLDDSRRLCRVSLMSAPGVCLHGLESGVLMDSARALSALEMAGVCARVCRMTVEYVKTRKQFGVSVGGFQAVQHKLADMFAQTEALRALGQFAAWTVSHSATQRALAALSALSFAREIGPAQVEASIQLHGGIGFTWEYDLHLYLRRAKTLEVLCGSEESDYAQLLDVARA